jgi:hypothetical protein
VSVTDENDPMSGKYTWKPEAGGSVIRGRPGWRKQRVDRPRRWGEAWDRFDLI